MNRLILIFVVCGCLAEDICLQLNPNLQKDKNYKQLEIDCESSFNLIHKCDITWTNAANITYYWTPSYSQTERQLITLNDEVFEIDENRKSKNTNFTSLSRTEFKKVHEGKYRCQGQRNCNGTLETDNYIYNVQLSKKQR